MAETGLSVGIKGTLLYMAPEQIQMKPASPASDVFSLGVVCYESADAPPAVRRRQGCGDRGRDSGNRASAGVRPEPGGQPDPQPRDPQGAWPSSPGTATRARASSPTRCKKGCATSPSSSSIPSCCGRASQRATEAFEQGDLQFASEILSELEAEGHIDPAIVPLKRQIESAGKQKTIAAAAAERPHALRAERVSAVAAEDPGDPATGPGQCPGAGAQGQHREQTDARARSRSGSGWPSSTWTISPGAMPARRSHNLLQLRRASRAPCS